MSGEASTTSADLQESAELRLRDNYLPFQDRPPFAEPSKDESVAISGPRCSAAPASPIAPSVVLEDIEETPNSKRLAQQKHQSSTSSNETVCIKTFTRPGSQGSDSIFSFAPTTKGKPSQASQLPAKSAIYMSASGSSSVLPPVTERLPSMPSPVPHRHLFQPASQTVNQVAAAVEQCQPNTEQDLASNQIKTKSLGTEQESGDVGGMIEATTSTAPAKVDHTITSDAHSTSPQDCTIDNPVTDGSQVLSNNAETNPDVHKPILATTTPNTLKLRGARGHTPTCQSISKPVLTPHPGYPEPRITKSHPKAKVSNGATAQTTPNIRRSSRGPTEDDLLHILIHRNKRREEDAANLQSVNEILLQQHSQLVEDHERCTSDLQQALAVSFKLQEQQKSKENDLTAIKQKYCKIKKWAREINQDYAALRIQAEGLKHTTQDLTTEKEEIKTCIKDIKSASSEALVALRSHIKEIPELRKAVEELGAALLKADKDLEAGHQSLVEEKCRNRKFENHVIALQHNQQQSNRQFGAQNDAIHRTMSAISKTVERVQSIADSQQKPSTELLECLGLLQAINGKEFATVSDVNMLGVSLEGLNANLSERASVFDKGFKVLLSRTAQRSVVEDLRQDIKELKPDMEAFQEMKVERQRLEEKVAGKAELIQLLQQSSLSAESYASSFQKGNEVIVDWIKHEKSRASKQYTDLEHSSAQLRIKWTAISSELVQAQSTLRQAEQTNRELSATLSGFQERLGDERARREAAEATGSNSERMYWTQHTQDKLENENLVKEQTDRIAALQAELQQYSQKESGMKKEIDHLTSLHHECQASRDSVVLEVQRLESEIKQASADSESIHQRLEEASSIAATLPALQEQLKKSESEITTLRAEQTVHDQIREKLRLIEQDRVAKDCELVSLQAQLQDALSASKKVVELEELLNNSKEERKTLEEKLGCAEKSAEAIIDLQTSLEREKLRAEVFEGELREARHARDTIRTISKEKIRLNLKVAYLTIQLKTANGLVKAQETVEMALLERDQKIAQLEEKVKTFTHLEKELEVERDESRLKDAEIKLQKEEIDRLKEGSQELHYLRDMTVDDLLQNFPSQMSDLSLPSLIPHAEDPAQSGATSLVDNAELPDNIATRRPQRQAADRSGLCAANAQPDLHASQKARQTIVASSQRIATAHLLVGAIEASATNNDSAPEGSLNFVPESQYDSTDVWSQNATPLLNSHLHAALSSSSLSELSSAFDQLENDDQDNQPNVQEQATQTLQNSQLFSGAVDEEPTCGRPSSSALSDDLFKQHSTRLQVSGSSLSSQRQSHGDIRLNALPQQPEAMNGHSICETQVSGTASGTSKPSNQSASKKANSRPLRNVSRTGTREATPFPGSQPELALAGSASPQVVRDKNQPNSAAKRRVDNGKDTDAVPMNGKRFKRNPTHLHVRPPPQVSRIQSPVTSQNKASSSSLMRKGIVVGSKAPAPGKGQRGSKAARKNSKHVKYQSQFGRDA